MYWRQLAKQYAHWTMPPGVQDLLRSYLVRKGMLEGPSSTDPEAQAILNRNKKFLNKHTGERCFILATGPSIRDEDLTPLRNEYCFAVSEFYKHEDYNLIKPAYHAMAPSHHPFTEADVLRLWGELKQRSVSETFFFGLRDKDIIRRSGLFPNSNSVYYIDFGGDSAPASIDLTKRLPAPQTAALIATWIGLYMGFSEIYLVGCDWDALWKWDGSTEFTRDNYYKHFYDGVPTAGYEPMAVESELKSMLRLRQQFRWTNQAALGQNTKIFNANPRSYLEIIPKVSLASLF